MREFTVSAGGITTVAAVVTLVFINPTAAPNMNIEVLRAWVSQTGSSTSSQQRVQLVSQVSAFPTLTSATPRPHKHADSASVIVGGTAGAAGTAGINASAEGAGAKTVKIDDAFNILNGWLWVATPAETIVMPAGSLSGIGLYLPVAPGTTSGWSFGITYREV